LTAKLTRIRGRILITLIAVLGAPTLSFAQVDTSEWLCESCPFDEGYRASYEAGATYVSDDAARFGNATGYDKQGGYINLDGEGHYTDDGYSMDWYIEDLGLDSRVAELEGGRQGSFGYYLGYRELPYRLFDTTRTVFSPSDRDSLSLPVSWVPAGTTSGMTQLNASLQKRTIESDRQIIDFGGDWLPGEKYRVFADYRHQARDGIDITAGSGYTQSSLLPRVFDFQTDQIDVGMQYRGKRSSVTFAYYGSFFSNRNSSLTWDTPFIAPPGAQQLTMSQEPDNEFQQLSLSGAYRVSTWDTVVAFSLATGRGEQNETFLPYTSNPNVNAGPLPRNSLNGKVSTGNYALTVTAKPSSRSRVKLAYRQDERYNRSPRNTWTRVIVDLFDSGDSEMNTAYSFKRSRLNLDGDLRVSDTVRLAAGYDRTDYDRDYQEVAEQSENSGWGQVRWQPASGFDLRARVGASKREIDRYDETVAVNLGQNPLMRKYNLAYRYRTFGELTASASLAESPLSISATVLAADDSYTKSQLGMTGSNELRVTADVSWAISERTSTYLMFGNETIDAAQLGSQASAEADWRASHEDSFNHIGVGFLWREINEKIDLRFDYTRGDGATKIVVASKSFGGQSVLPDLKSTLDSLRLEGTYRWSERFNMTMDLRFEGFSSEDWALQDVLPDTLPTILTLGAQPYDYNVWAMGIGFRYNFGTADIALVN
jgi:MtrB/PioB family decaheme-associated outer membrane protein